MRIALKLLLSLLLAGIFLFSIYGFLSTFEPIPLAVQITWRIIYPVVGLGCMAGIVWTWRRGPRGTTVK